MPVKPRLLLLCSLLLFSAGTASASGQYLLLSHDPEFLLAIEGLTDTVYDRGRVRLVTLRVPEAGVPSDIMRFLRPVENGEIASIRPQPPQKLSPDPAVQAVTSLADQSSLLSFTNAIVASGKRSTRQLDLSPSSGNRAAMDYIYAAFRRLGYEAERQCYKDRKADKECNIVARRRAGTPGARAVLVIGHMDSVGYENAGADDNASGAAGVLEMARVLSRFRSDHDLIFVAANGEETGMAGSQACARLLKASGELARVDWAINMDMIAWNRDGVMNIETNKEFSSHADWVAAQAYTYTRLKPVITMPAWGSDHVPFLEAGIPTYLAIENWEDHTPCYHQACDTADSLAVPYAADIVRLNLAVIAGKTRLTPAD
ncbi:MAG: M28 family peptidase [Elusimicrobia bacterium]|nr:M28 family peptidase [Elusimicrobiota bacterium]